MKKTFVLILVLVLVFALCACGSKTVVGTWEAQQSLTKIMGASDSALVKYMTDVNILVRLELEEDGSFVMTMDGTSMIPALRDAVKSYLEDSCAANGTSLDALAAAGGLTADQLIDKVMESQNTETLTRSVNGTYTVEDSAVTLNFETGTSRTGTWEKDQLSIPTEELGDINFIRCK